MYEYNKGKLSDTWLEEKSKELDLYLDGIEYINITLHLEEAIRANTDLSRCRTLDAIHIATALEVRKMSGDEAIMLYTFDKNMYELAKYFGFQTNKL
ncbi:hypothetical protein FACS189444_3480 [Spirochaetia bacterium]|nr:hypothetical protein FACS189444_3480 [Spirochaetia bacterium]